LAIVYITHDLATAYYIIDNVSIMRKGEIVERGRARAVLDDPQHPYSRALI
ncbi:ABC transporter ATP-binding protein, partial [Rhizobium ruizarguesonis]